jgi:hypothetical protein
MASSDRDSVYSTYSEQLALPAGVTAAIPAMRGQIGAILKYVSGGSLSVVGASTSFGSTFAIGSLYTLGTTEVLNISMSGTLFLQGGGSTCVAQILRLRSAGDF